MRIDFLRIPAARNLRNFEIDFDQRAPLTVLLGQNGSGKSNLIESIIEIFLALEQAQTPEFAFEMQYFCYGKTIHVQADPALGRGERLQITADGKAVSLKRFRDNARDYLPAHIFAYYSGTNARLEGLFAEPTKRYYKANLSEVQGRTGNTDGLRRFFLCRKEYAELAFLALFFDTSEFAGFIRSQLLGFESFDSTLFILKTPWWAKNRQDFFWGARGSFTEFLGRLKQFALAPIKNEESLELDVRGRTQGIERLYLFIQQLEQLRAPNESTKLMFNHLESMYLSDLIEEVRVNGLHTSGQRISVRQLSEGERQLVIVFGLLLFTHEDEVLYLLDEPDSHLNPKWVYDYMTWLGDAFLEKESKEGLGQVTPQGVNPLLEPSEPTIPGASQVILATHNPLMIGTLRQNQVRIMRRNEHGTTATEPNFDPIGVGVEGLMKTELFGLRSTLAPEILEKLDRHYWLLGQAQKTEAEQLELIQLGEELNALAVSRTHPNPYFELFATAMAQRTPNPEKTQSMEEVKAQTALAEEILAEILKEEAATQTLTRQDPMTTSSQPQAELFVQDKPEPA
jgi:predicted ATPase